MFGAQSLLLLYSKSLCLDLYHVVFFVRAGLGKGDTVTLMLPNRADFYVPVLAAWRCGAAVSLVDPLQQPGQSSSRPKFRPGRKNTKADKTAAEYCVSLLKSAESLSFQFDSI
jgi:acyl-CoA synthetase (AMP-forming)/AMP-acid ligase II